MSVPNLPTEVLVTDTFEQWRVKTNSIISAVGNDTILLNELPEINANTVLGNSTTALARPIAITVATTGGITLTDNALKLVTPTGGITLTGGALSLATTVAGAGLALNSGVLSIPLTTTGISTPTSNSGLKFVTAAAESGPIAQINAGLGVSLLANGGITLTGGALALVTPTGGITLTGGALALATTVAGAGLALTSGVLSIPLTTTGNGATPTANSGLKFVTGSGSGTTQINAGLGVSLLANGGITLSSGALALATTVAGAGLTLTSGALAINYNTNHFQISSSQLTLSAGIANRVTRGTAAAWIEFKIGNNVNGVVSTANPILVNSYNIPSVSRATWGISGFSMPIYTLTFASGTFSSDAYTVFAYVTDIFSLSDIAPSISGSGGEGGEGLLEYSNPGNAYTQSIAVIYQTATSLSIRGFTTAAWHRNEDGDWEYHVSHLATQLTYRVLIFS